MTQTGPRFVVTSSAVLLILFVLVDNFRGSFLIVKRIEDLVEPRIALLVVQKINKLNNPNRIRLSFSATGNKRLITLIELNGKAHNDVFI